jgi:NADH:ubiquinone oxidoreductase subunit
LPHWVPPPPNHSGLSARAHRHTHRANNANNTHHPYVPRASIAAGINFADADGKESTV